MSSAEAQAWVVLKFGGTSVSTRARWETIGAIAKERKQVGERPFVVCSALSQVSNLLEEVVAGSLRGTHEAAIEEIIGKHVALAETLEVDAQVVLGDFFSQLRRVASGAALLGEASPRTHARLLSLGELMSTTLGAAFLQKQGMRVKWLDARTALKAIEDPNASERRAYLSSACDYRYDSALVDEINAEDIDIVLTQGFIGTNDDGDTVLLGRGGSDTSAAYFATKIGARRCEIWTDVPGMFTCDPRVVPVARHILFADYDEAQEIATTGAKVLHPRCIIPCREHNVPMEIRSTPMSSYPGTVIGAKRADQMPGVKALSTKKGINLISMDSLDMWQQAGFLANVFACFKEHGLSVDQVSTSEMNVTVTLDPTANTLTDEIVEALLEDLQRFCRARRIEGCAAVSLVGTGIRSILHRLGEALQLFEEPSVYMVTQSASDLNLTFIVDEEHATRLLAKLHRELFKGVSEGTVFGQTWEAINGDEPKAKLLPRWWHTRRDELLGIDLQGGPAYVYDVASIRRAAQELMGMRSVSKVFYAMKANSNVEILRIVESEGLGFECVSPGEMARVFEVFPGIDSKRVLFTPNFAPLHEYAEAFERGVNVNLDNMYPLQARPELFAGREVFIRIDPGTGKGHHDKVKTGGRGSKFGIDAEDLPELRRVAAEHGVKIVGLHVHAGSGILSSDHWREVATLLLKHAEEFPDLRFFDLGGGLGIVERNDQTALDLAAVDASLAMVRQARPDIELWMEPGRYLVATAGILLTKVTQLKGKGEMQYVGVDAGMHSLVRPTLYGAFHGIANLTRLGEPATISANIVGPICETGDILGVNRAMPEAQEGDVILIDTAGAYGYTMASNYNLRGLPREILV